jgi:parallel beta-helix repeat protein
MMLLRCKIGLASLLLAMLLGAALHACGGGDSGALALPTSTPGGPGDPTSTPGGPGDPTSTPGGPGDPTSTPGGPVEPTPIVVFPGDDLGDRVMDAPAGSTVVVAPGSYDPLVLSSGDVQPGVILEADVTGFLTGSPGAAVTIAARRGERAAVDLVGIDDLLLDGFSIRGGAKAGVVIESSANITLLNCLITRNPGDGVLIDDSFSSFLFNNLIWVNSLSGIHVRDSDDAAVYNNTVWGNDGRGIFVDDSFDIFLRNNIFDSNGGNGIEVDDASFAFDGEYNLNTDGYSGVDQGFGDITDSPLFVAPSDSIRGEGFRLNSGLVGSNSPALEAGDPLTPASLIDALTVRTTRVDNGLDAEPVDMGYHYALQQSTPTAQPTPTLTPTPTLPITPGTTPPIPS